MNKSCNFDSKYKTKILWQNYSFFLFIISTALYSQPVAAEEVLKDDVTNGLVWYSIPLRGHSSNSSDDTILRSPALTPVKAFMCEKTMRLDFSSSIKDVIITVVNASTGEVVYSENFATPGGGIYKLRCRRGW